MVHGSESQCAALANDEEFRRASIDAALIVENFGVVPAVTGDGVGRQMAMYSEAVAKVGIGGHRSPALPTTAVPDARRPGRSGASDDAAQLWC
jgi:hypothetical protein